MSLFIDVKVRLKVEDSCLKGQIRTADGQSNWFAVSDEPSSLAESLSYLSGIKSVSDLYDHRTKQMRNFFGKISDKGRNLLDSAIQKLNLYQSHLRILIEPVDDESRLKAYNLPAEIWSFSSIRPSRQCDPDNPLPSIVRLVRRDRIKAKSIRGDWRVAWIGGLGSMDTLPEVVDILRGPGLKFVGAFPLSYAEDLHKWLVNSAANIVWLVGHSDQESSSLLSRNKEKIGVDKLCNAFQGIESLQLLFIHSCHIGNLSIGLAERLIREAGIPMVVTWETRNGVDQGKVHKDILPTFATNFFDHFRDGKPAEMALAKARYHLLRFMSVGESLNCKFCPLAFKATGAGDIRITKRRPVIDKPLAVDKALLPRLTQAYRLEESSQINEAREIYKTLTNCDDAEIARIAAIRLHRLSLSGEML